MAIRFKHDPSAVVGVAGYAVGRGQARKRRQKYAMDILRDERRLQARTRYGLGMRQLGQRRTGQRRLAGDGLPFEGAVWKDPFAEAQARAKSGTGTMGDRRAAITARAQQKANARRRRLYARYGMGVHARVRYPDAEPGWRQGPTKDDIEWQRVMDETRRQESREGRKAEAAGLPDLVPEWAPNRQKLLGEANILADMLTGDRINWTNAQQAEAARRRIDAFKKRMTEMEEPDPNLAGWVMDDKGGFRRPKPGEHATHDDNGPGTLPTPTKETIDRQKEEKALKDKEEADEKARLADEKAERIRIEDKIDVLKKEWRTLKGKGSLDTHKKAAVKAIETEWKQLEKELKYAATGMSDVIPSRESEGFFPETSKQRKRLGTKLQEVEQELDRIRNDPNISPREGSALRMELYKRKAALHEEARRIDSESQDERPLPPDVPPGTKWIGPKTLRYPDGRTFEMDGGS